jgi:hypothetical protein
MPRRGPRSWHAGLDKDTIYRIEKLVIGTGFSGYDKLTEQLQEDGINVSRSGLARYGRNLLLELRGGILRHDINRCIEDPEFRRQLIAYGAAMLEQQLLHDSLESLLTKHRDKK